MGADVLTRRRFLGLTGRGAIAVTAVGAAGLTVACDPGPLEEPDENGVRLPAGFRSRIVATTGEAVAGTGYVWHTRPDGGACFALPDGGWSYVSNSEWLPFEGAGASYVRFDRDGNIVGAGRCLGDTLANCAGGKTPWGTWLSCEEWPLGQVWECDPVGAVPAVARPAMGRFQHEAAAADPVSRCVYLTEDVRISRTEPGGALYRFVPTTWGDLSSGTLQVLAHAGDEYTWVTVPDPSGQPVATRNQVDGTVRFDGGEGIDISNGRVVFATKGDNRVWLFDPADNSLQVLYDAAVQVNGVLSGVDNIGTTAAGVIYVAEDGGNMQIVLLREDGRTFPVVELPGVEGSEICGPAFDPSGKRLYFSSQRNPGATYEVRGNWGLFTVPGPP